MPQFLLRRAALAGAVSSILLACSHDPSLTSDVTENVETPIINGAPTADPKYAAVGALVYYFPGAGVLDVFCTATLVAPGAVVTARHCTPSIDLAFESGVLPAVAFGPDAFNPTQIVPITSYVAAPAAPPPAPGNQQGLLLTGGRDVAVAYLESTPVGLTPVKVGEFAERMIGSQFQIVGYGVRNALGYYGEKYAGQVTARTTSGRWYQLLFGTYQAFEAWYFTDAVTANPTQAEAKEWWKVYALENKYELLAGGLPGEALGCNGDSGGPLLLGSSVNDITTYGVSFAVEQSLSNYCAYGGAYLVFNRKMLDFVHSAL